MSSEMCDLKTPGFSDFIHMMAFALSWKNTFEAGMDSTRDNVRFRLPTIGEFVFARELCYCTTLYSRGTEVLLLEECADGQAGTSPAQGAGQDTPRGVAPTSASAPRRITRSSAKQEPTPSPSSTPAPIGRKRKTPDKSRDSVMDQCNQGGCKSSNKRLKRSGESMLSDTPITEEDVIYELRYIS